MTKIFQYEPTLVFQTETEVLKIFPVSEACDTESDILGRNKGELLSRLPNGEKLRLVKINWKQDCVLAMEIARGKVLTDTNCERDSKVVLAASLLAVRHREIAGDENRYFGFLLGDFVMDHLFYDDRLNTMTLIDPGMNFYVEGNLAEDCARFIFSVLAAFRFRPLVATRLVAIFLETYLSQSDLGMQDVEAALKVRFDRSKTKYRMQKTKSRAFLATSLLQIHHYLIKIVLSKFNE